MSRSFHGARAPILPFALVLFAVAISSPAAASSTLFPNLAVEDFPETPDTVRFEVAEARAGFLSARAFHGRPGNIGFPSLLTAVVSTDSETRRDRLEIVRLDDDCTAAAEQLRLAPEEVCISLTVSEVVDGVAKLVFRSRYFDYQVQLTLAQSVTDGSHWTLIPTGRRGEPQRLELRTHEDDRGQLRADWLAYNRSATDEVSLPLSASFSAAELRATGFTALQVAALAAVDLFYDIAAFYKDAWVVYQEDQIVDEGIPSPEENDPSQCEPVGVCGAEHETCIPTHNGWYGCNIPTEVGGWGGGYYDPPGGGSGGGGHDDPNPLPNWVVGSYDTQTMFPPPVFRGMKPFDDGTPGYFLDFELTSVLERADTVAKKATLASIPIEGSHMVRVDLRFRDGRLAQPRCGEIHFLRDPAGAPIFVGSAFTYPNGRHIACEKPLSRGLYFLRWELDPHSLWDEGADGEADNDGHALGIWYYLGY